jgi:hypothetical protein
MSYICLVAWGIDNLHFFVLKTYESSVMFLGSLALFVLCKVHVSKISRSRSCQNISGDNIFYCLV